MSEVEKLHERLEDITQLWLADVMDDAEFHRRAAHIKERIARLEREHELFPQCSQSAKQRAGM